MGTSENVYLLTIQPKNKLRIKLLEIYIKKIKVHFTPFNNSICPFDTLQKIMAHNIAPIEVCIICFSA
jgi:hypothetical protein